MAPSDADSTGHKWWRSRRSLPLLPSVLCLALIGALAGYAGYDLGAHGSAVMVLTGHAYSAPAEIGAEANGQWYEVPLDVPWIGTNGAFNTGSRPACLPPIGTIARVRFGVTEASQGGSSWGAVVWVSCAN